MAGPSVHLVQDPLFDEVRVAVEAGRSASVTGPAVPDCHLERTDDSPATSRWTSVPPIGTRDAAGLRLTGDGRVWRLEIGRGRLARSSYRVRARHEDEALTLTPCDPYSSRLVRGPGRRRPELGRATTTGPADVGIAWTGPDGPDAVTPTPLEASLGYLLAAAFDTGAELALVALVGGGVDVVAPG